MKIIFMGTPTFSCGILEALNEKYEVVAVVSQPDKLVGRKKKLTFTPLKETALKLGIPVYQPVKIKNDYGMLLELGADTLVTAAYGQIVPEAFLNGFKICINVHASLLPKYRGGAPIQRSIMNGDKETGVTIMEMVKAMDAGRIFAVESLKIEDTDNNEILFEKLSVLGCKLLMNNIEDIYNGKNKGSSQRDEEVTYAYNIKRSEEQIDFNKTSREVFNCIRGLAVEPGSYAVINDEPIKIYSSKELFGDFLGTPGTVLKDKKELIVKTKDSAISLLKVQPRGKKVMDASSFLNGQKLFVEGDTFKYIKE